MNIEQEEQDDFDKKASALYLWYLKYLVEYIDEAQYEKGDPVIS